MLSNALLAFLENRPGESFTAGELQERVRWPGRVLPCHVQQALERKLFLEGAVAADRIDLVDGGGFPARAVPGTRWAALETAPPGFLAYDPSGELFDCVEMRA